MEAIQPELKLLEQFVISDLQNVMGIDALETSHPINQPVSHPSEIQELFDRISYAKGASIIRMMDKFLTTETFRKVSLSLSSLLSLHHHVICRDFPITSQPWPMMPPSKTISGDI